MEGDGLDGGGIGGAGDAGVGAVGGGSEDQETVGDALGLIGGFGQLSPPNSGVASRQGGKRRIGGGYVERKGNINVNLALMKKVSSACGDGMPGKKSRLLAAS